jgi:hypothetical protein
VLRLIKLIFSVVTITMPMAEQPTTPITIQSSELKTHLTSLNLRKSELEHTQSGWEMALSIGLTVAAIVAAFLFVFDLGVRRYSKRIQEVQDEIIRNKDAELQLALGEKDLKIAELQKAGLPRNLDVSITAGKLRRFAETPVSFETLMEFEPSRTMNLVLSALTEAKWRIAGTGSSSGMGMSGGLSRPGVWIEVTPSPPEENGPRTGEIIRHSNKERAAEVARLSGAAEALMTALNEEGVATHIRPSSTPWTVPGGVHVFIGLKPFPGMPDDLRVTIPTH